jgi:hypothetical protein
MGRPSLTDTNSTALPAPESVLASGTFPGSVIWGGVLRRHRTVSHVHQRVGRIGRAAASPVGGGPDEAIKPATVARDNDKEPLLVGPAQRWIEFAIEQSRRDGTAYSPARQCRETKERKPESLQGRHKPQLIPQFESMPLHLSIHPKRRTEHKAPFVVWGVGGGENPGNFPTGAPQKLHCPGLQEHWKAPEPALCGSLRVRLRFYSRLPLGPFRYR